MKTMPFLAIVLAAMTASAHAQDVVVIRRVIAPANRANPVPVPSPAPSPAPSPSPAPRPVTYAWVDGAYTDYAPKQCGATATRTRTDVCLSSDGVVVDRSKCDPSAPHDATDRITWEVGCTYTPTYGPYGSCTGGSKTANMTACTSSDGIQVDPAKCGARQIHQACVATLVTCGEPMPYRTVTNLSGDRLSASGLPTLQKAKEACETLSRNVRVCYIDRNASIYNVYTWPAGSVVTGPGATTYASTCTAN